MTVADFFPSAEVSAAHPVAGDTHRLIVRLALSDGGVGYLLLIRDPAQPDQARSAAFPGPPGGAEAP